MPQPPRPCRWPDQQWQLCARHLLGAGRRGRGGRGDEDAEQRCAGEYVARERGGHWRGQEGQRGRLAYTQHQQVVPSPLALRSLPFALTPTLFLALASSIATTLLALARALLPSRSRPRPRCRPRRSHNPGLGSSPGPIPCCVTWPEPAPQSNCNTPGSALNFSVSSPVAEQPAKIVKTAHLGGGSGSGGDYAAAPALARATTEAVAMPPPPPLIGAPRRANKPP